MRILRIVSFLAWQALVPALFGGTPALEPESPPRPEIWGDVGLRGYFTGDRVAPNGLTFDPLFDVGINLNIGLLPQKQLYSFVAADFWGQRAAPGVTNAAYGSYDFSKREYDFTTGLAWNIIDRFELRGSFFSFNNLNRGSSTTIADTHQNGLILEARRYFGNADIYDVGRLSFVGLGYYPQQNLMGGAGTQFVAGPFAEAYFAYDIPALRSYIYLGAEVISQGDFQFRSVKIDGGIGVRPLASLPNLELRVGDDFTADVKDDTNRNLVYGEFRTYFGGESDSKEKLPPTVYDPARFPEIWGDVGFSMYPGGERVAANGVEFTPLFMTNIDLNIGILPAKKLYVFTESQFWIQRESDSGYVRGRDPGQSDVTERELDFDIGLAFRLFGQLEWRGSLYAQNNLNRGGGGHQPPSPGSPSGYHDGGYLQLRYYFTSANPYDPPRQSFAEIGLYPTKESISGVGSGIHPRAYGRLYLSHDFQQIRSYVYGDGTIVTKDSALGLITLNGGFAIRPLASYPALEFRVGNELTREIGPAITRDLTYGAIRINFSTR